MKNKPNFCFITGVSQTGGVGGPPLGNFPHIIPFFSDRVPNISYEEEDVDRALVMLLRSLKTNAIQTNIALKHHPYHLNL